MSISTRHRRKHESPPCGNIGRIFMVSPGSKQEQEARLQRRLNAWATAELDPRARFRNVQAISRSISLRGRKGLIRKFGIRFVERIEEKSQAHLFNRWIALRKGLELEAPTKKELEQIPKAIREQAGIKIRPEKQKVLFIRHKLGLTRVKDSTGQLHWRSLKTGRFMKAPHRKRSR
jgi:hypothetical protein